jgi:chromosome segregation ATPase
LKSLDELKQTVRNTKADFLTVTQHLQTTREAFDGTEKKIELLGQTIDRLDSKSSYIHQLLVDAKSNVTNLAREKQKYAKKVSELSQTKQEALATEAAKKKAEEELKAAQEQLKTVQAENERKTTELANATKTLHTLQAAKNNAEQKLKTERAENKRKHDQINANKTKIEHLTKRLKEEEETTQNTLDNIKKMTDHAEAWMKVHKELLASFAILNEKMANSAHPPN